MKPDLVVQDTEVFVHGSGDHTVVMVHGWPDTYRLWDGAVQALQSRYRCVRFNCPGSDAPPVGPVSTLSDITARLLAIVDQVSPDQPVTLLLHDWGCLFGYELAARHPHRVARVIGVDIGDATSPAYLKTLTVRQKLMILTYQLWLATTWLIGRHLNGSVADVMTRLMAQALRCPTPKSDIRWFMNLPYAMAWFGVGGGLRGALSFAPHCPMLYLYGKRKPFMFHSEEWLERLNAAPQSKAVGLPSGHWVMVDQAAELEAQLLNWMAECDKNPPHEAGFNTESGLAGK